MVTTSYDSILWLAATVSGADRATLSFSAAELPFAHVTGEIDEIQARMDEGPGLTAARTGSLVVADDLVGDARWPHWTPTAVALGVRSVMAVRLPAPAPPGSLNLYSVEPRTYDDATIERTRAIAVHAASVVVDLIHVAHLERAVESRTVIGQAQGILVERHHLTDAEAFDVLRRCSQRRNIKLHLLAVELVTTGDLPALGPVVASVVSERARGSRSVPTEQHAPAGLSLNGLARAAD